MSYDCGYCGEPAVCNDHIVPKCQGGGSEPANLRRSCLYCNAAKAGRTVEAFRWHMSVRHSILDGVISGTQAKAMAGLGIELPVPRYVFAFEREAA